MVIKSSSSAQIQTLLKDLASDDETRREAAVVRLSVIGGRAVDRLLEVVKESSGTTKAAALRVLEAIGDERSASAAVEAIDDGDPRVARSAVAVARRLLTAPGPGTMILDRLTELALDSRRDEQLRIDALEAISDLPAAVVAPLWKSLEQDASVNVRQFVKEPPGRARIDPLTALESAARGDLTDAESLMALLSAASESAPLTVLQHLIDTLHAREQEETSRARREQWRTARAATHWLLAKRDSRVALYDLRETLETASDALPGEFVSAVAAIGDASCLEALAAAYERALSTRTARDDLWRRDLAAAFRTIVRRERISSRHRVTKRIRTRWPSASRDLLT